MTGWLLRRLGQMIIVILGVVSLAFLLSYVVPGDPARLVAGPNASPQAVASIARQLGLDQSVWSQYVSYLGRLAHGNLGTSFALEDQSVGGEIWRALPYTVWLAVGGVLRPRKGAVMLDGRDWAGRRPERQPPVAVSKRQPEPALTR